MIVNGIRSFIILLAVWVHASAAVAQGDGSPPRPWQLAEAQARSRELAAKVATAGDLSAVHSRTLQRFRGRYESLVNVLSDGSYSKWREASDGSSPSSRSRTS